MAERFKFMDSKKQPQVWCMGQWGSHTKHHMMLHQNLSRVPDKNIENKKAIVLKDM